MLGRGGIFVLIRPPNPNRQSRTEKPATTTQNGWPLKEVRNGGKEWKFGELEIWQAISDAGRIQTQKLNPSNNNCWN